MPLFRVDIVLYASLYVRADGQAQAAQQAKSLANRVLVVADAGGSEVPISACRFNDPDLPDLSLAPAMTIIGPGDNDEPELMGA